jgi:DNA-binding NarL/FixJ family response regulator
VLLADDHTRLREALRDLLEETGFQVVGESGDGADAVAMARELEPDIVVIDLRMPVLNGLDATRLIKDARPATQVVVLSAFESPELERQASEAGAFASLDKGTMARRIHRILLGAAVQAVLAASGTHRAAGPARSVQDQGGDHEAGEEADHAGHDRDQAERGVALGAGDAAADDPDQAPQREHDQPEAGQDQAGDRPGPPGDLHGVSHRTPGAGAGPGPGRPCGSA